MVSKAHTTVVNRLLRRYGGESHTPGPIDIRVDGLLIAVENTATMPDTIPQLLALTGQRYIAVTNGDSLQEALRLTAGTPLGVMDAQGEIKKPAQVPEQTNPE